MIKKIISLLTISIPIVGLSQIRDNEPYKYHHNYASIGVGLGTSNYFGELMQVPENSAARKSTPSLQFFYLNPLNDALLIKANYINTKLSHWGIANDEVHNFMTKLNILDLGLVYRLDNGKVLETNSAISPFFGGGLGFGFFNTKADLQDGKGNTYYYWSNGKIMNLPESDPNAGDAQLLYRDYIFETDIRSLTDFKNNGLTYYLEAGFGLKITSNLTANFSYKHSFMRNDYLDGVSSDNKKDHYNTFAVSLAYNFGKNLKTADELERDEAAAVMSTEDEDGDGVYDMEDLCPHTEKNFAVSENGCPIDSDHDGIPDAIDAEPLSPHTIVDSEGRVLSEEAIEVKYLLYSGEMAGHEKYEEYKAKYPELFEAYENE